MSTPTQTQLPKHKPQPLKETPPVKAAATPQPSRLSREELRHIIEMIG